MPLYLNARKLIRTNLERFDPVVKVRVQAVAIGELTDRQLTSINARQAQLGLPGIVGEVVFVGWHVYKSRVIKDGYRIEDVMDQIESALHPESVLVESDYMTALENPNDRTDKYGNNVRDRAILECLARYPRPELFSVIPKDDVIKPVK